MTGFKPRTSGIGSNHSTNWVTTTAQSAPYWKHHRVTDQVVVGQLEGQRQHWQDEDDGDQDWFPLLVDQVLHVWREAEGEQYDVLQSVQTVEHQLTQERGDVEAWDLYLSFIYKPASLSSISR